MEYNQSNSAFLIVEDNGRTVREVQALKPTKPGIVFLGGNFTITPDEVMRNLVIIKSILGKSGTSNYSIYSVGYKKGSVLTSQMTVSSKYDFGDYLDLAGRIFLPRIAKETGRLSFEQASKNLDNMVVFGHSAGAVVMGEMMEALPVLMSSIGYSNKEIKLLMKKIEFVGYSPYGMVHAPISAYYITPINDSLHGWVEPLILRYGLGDITSLDLNRKYIQLTNKLKTKDFVAYSGNSFGGRFVNITTGPLRKDCGEDHGFAGIMRNEMGENPYASSLGIEVGELIKTILLKHVNLKKESTIQNHDEFKTIYELVKKYLELLSQYNKNKSKSEREIVNCFIEIINLKTVDEAVQFLTNKFKGDNDGWGI